LKTNNIFIECSRIDLNEAKMVPNTMATMFSMYYERKLEVEPVEVINPDEKLVVYPDLSI